MKSILVVLTMLTGFAASAAELHIFNSIEGLYAMDAKEFAAGMNRNENVVPGNEDVAQFLASIPSNSGTVCDADFYTINGIHYVYAVKDCTPPIK